MKAERCLPAALSLMFVLTGAAWGASPTDEELAKTIQAAEILPKGWKVIAKTISKEVLISTFRAPDTNMTDCKIDATMIAKILMIDNDFGISRVRVQFHEPAGKASVYQQVSVSLAEIKGYASGAVTKDQFLDSLELQRLAEAKPVQKPKPVEMITVRSNRLGLSFKVPSDWNAKEYASGATILELTPKDTKFAGIELSYEPEAASPSARADLQRRKFTYPGTSFVRYLPSTNFGTGPYPGSLVMVKYPHDSNVPYYDMNLYFGTNYKVWAWCDVPTYSLAGPAFESILKTMTFPPKKKTK